MLPRTHEAGRFPVGCRAIRLCRRPVSPDGHRLPLYKAITALLPPRVIYRLYSLITVPNPVSVGFHEAYGFSLIATYPATGYKLGAWHDMVVMERPLRELQEEPKPPVSWREMDSEFVEMCLKKCDKFKE